MTNTVKDQVIEKLYAMLKADEQGDGNASNEYMEQIIVLMNKLYPDVYVDEELLEIE